jgi:hypothetical protein
MSAQCEGTNEPLTVYGAVLALLGPASTVSEGARPRRHSLGLAFLQASHFPTASRKR